MEKNKSDVNEINSLEKISEEYTKPDAGRMVDKKLFSLIADELMPLISGPEVLEMGFGDDEWTSKIIQKIGHSNIVDASRNLLSVAKAKYKNTVNIYESLFENFSPDKKFNTILASYILEHVEDPVSVLKGAREWMVDSGKLIAIVPHAGSLHRRLAVTMGLQENVSSLGETDFRLGHRRVYDIELFEKHIKAAGYIIEMKKGLFIKPLPQSMMTDFSDEMLKGFMELSKQLPMEYSALIVFVCS
jgi:trans-aconitate methyltransferase